MAGHINDATKKSAPNVTRECSYCSTSETPMWRVGPLGAKTLCNACGVRWRKGKLTSKDGVRAPPAPVRASGSGRFVGQGQVPPPPPPQQQQQNLPALHASKPVAAYVEHFQPKGSDIQLQPQQSVIMRTSKPQSAGVSKPVRFAVQHRGNRPSAKQRTPQDGADLDLSMIYFYTEDDDDGSPALIEISSASEEDPVREKDMEYHESIREKVLANHHFSVLLSAARMIG